METIFDHNPTADELRRLAGTAVPEEYTQYLTADEALAGLSMLFAMRGDESTARAYADKISDKDYLRFTLLNGDFISEGASKNPNSATDNRTKAA